MRLFARSLLVFIFFLFVFLFPANVGAVELQPGSVWQWTNATSSATQKEGLTDIISVSVGNIHGLALKNDGTVWAWGNNGYGTRGTGIWSSDYSSKLLTQTQVKGEGNSGFLSQTIAIAAFKNRENSFNSSPFVVNTLF